MNNQINNQNEAVKSTFDLASFKRAQDKMISTNERAWDPPYSTDQKCRRGPLQEWKCIP